MMCTCDQEHIRRRKASLCSDVEQIVDGGLIFQKPEDCVT